MAKPVGLDKLVSIRWRDHWDSETWVKLENLENDCLIHSVGVVVRETPEFITIASHRGVGGFNESLIGTPTTIWKALVVAVDILDDGESPGRRKK